VQRPEFHGVSLQIFGFLRWRAVSAREATAGRDMALFKQLTSNIFQFSVILSEAKDLIAACHGHDILRFAQDDR
jgi:hypothetical protein